MHSGARTQVPVAHGDVKPANIIVSAATGGTVLVDLGLARLADATGVAGRSNPYAAPEIRTLLSQATPEADVYAFAVTTAQTLTGEAPPTNHLGFLDVRALQAQLDAAPLTQRRPMLAHQVLSVLSAPPEARPRQLRLWLDSAADTLSQITTPPAAVPQPPFAPTSVAGAYPVDTTVVRPGVTPPGPHGAGGPPPFVPPPGPPSGPPPGRPGSPPAHGFPPVAPRRPRRSRLPVIIAAVVVLLVAAGVVIAVIANHGSPQAAARTSTPNSGSKSSTSRSSSSTSSASDGDSQQLFGGATDSGTSSTLPPNTQLPATTQYIAELDTVATDAAANAYNASDTGSYDISGTMYGHSVSMITGCVNQDGGDYWQEYDLSRSWSTLSGVVGLDDRSPTGARLSWKLFGDSVLLASGSSTLGVSTPLNVSVKGVLRLRLFVTDPASTQNPCQGSGSNTGRFVWGNLQLTA